MQGEINVAQIIREQQRLEAFRETTAVREEIRVLFEWWKLRGAADKAKKDNDRLKRRAIALEQLQFTQLYGPELDRAMKKWNRAMAERAKLATRQRPRRALGVARSDWSFGASPSASPALRPASNAEGSSRPSLPCRYRRPNSTHPLTSYQAVGVTEKAVRRCPIIRAVSE